MESLWECRDLERFSRTLKSHSSGRNLDFSLLLNHLHSTLCYFPLQSLQNLFYTLPFCTDAAMGSVVIPQSLNTAKQRQIFSNLQWKWCTFRIFFFFLFQQLGLWFVCIYAQNNIYIQMKCWSFCVTAWSTVLLSLFSATLYYRHDLILYNCSYFIKYMLFVLFVIVSC